MATTQAKTPGQLVGSNIKRLREAKGWTQRETVAQARAAGLRWSHPQMASLESGRRADLDLSALAMLSHLFAVDAGELLAGEPVRLAEGVVTDDLWALLCGDASARLLLSSTAQVEAAFAHIGEGSVYDADERLADRLGVPLEEVLAAAERLWRRTLTEERDERARASVADVDDPDERRERLAAHRGHITRDLSEAIKAELSRPTKKARKR